MNVSLTPELETMVSEKVTSGLYNSASEVVRAGLRLLQEQDELHRLQLEALRRDIQIGIDQIERGEYTSYESAEALMEDIRTEVHARHRTDARVPTETVQAKRP